MSRIEQESDKKVVEIRPGEEAFERALMAWVRAIAQSNGQLVLTLERLRLSYETLLAGGTIKDADELLWQVERALTNAERAKNLLAPGEPPATKGTWSLK